MCVGVVYCMCTCVFCAHIMYVRDSLTCSAVILLYMYTCSLSLPCNVRSPLSAVFLQGRGGGGGMLC